MSKLNKSEIRLEEKNFLIWQFFESLTKWGKHNIKVKFLGLSLRICETNNVTNILRLNYLRVTCKL